jgi:hypothetical protein
MSSVFEQPSIPTWRGTGKVGDPSYFVNALPQEMKELSLDSSNEINIPPELLPHQRKHYLKIYNIIHQYGFYLDGSPGGCGKTVAACLLARELGYSLVVFCPVSLVATWEREADKYGVGIIAIVHHESMGGRNTSAGISQPTHGWLHRRVGKNGKKGERVIFEPTKLFLELLGEPVLVVLDECHKIKNDSAMSKAFQTLGRTIIEQQELSKDKVALERKIREGSLKEGQLVGQAKLAFLSATPYDTDLTNLLRSIALIPEGPLNSMNIAAKKMEYPGFEKFMERLVTRFPSLASQRDPARLLRLAGGKNPEIKAFITTTYVKHLKPLILSAMPKPDAPVHHVAAMCDVPPEEVQPLVEAISLLHNAVGWNAKEARIDHYNPNEASMMTVALRRIELAKVGMFIRMAKKALSHPNTKVQIFFSYTDPLLLVAQGLAEYSPLIVNGSVKGRDRDAVIQEYQTNPARRVILLNIKAGGQGIDLHDTGVNGYPEPRVAMISSTYSLIETHQATLRCARQGSISASVVMLMYANIGVEERSIMISRKEKSKRVEEGVSQEGNEKIVYPGDYVKIHFPLAE